MGVATASMNHARAGEEPSRLHAGQGISKESGPAHRPRSTGSRPLDPSPCVARRVATCHTWPPSNGHGASWNCDVLERNYKMHKGF